MNARSEARIPGPPGCVILGPVRFVVFGAGAVGATIGGRLFEAGHAVVLIARGAHHDALVADGLDLRDPDGAVTLRVPTVAHPSEIDFGPDDVVLLTMKTQDTSQALADLRASAPPRIPVVCAQNGVDNERQAARLFPAVYGLCVILPAQHLEPGVVWAACSPVAGVLDLGRYPRGIDPTAVEIATALDGSGLRSEANPDIMRRKRAKLLMNLANALDAACGAGARGSELHLRARAEATACFEAGGLGWSADEEDRERRALLSPMRVVPGQHPHASSTWQSMHRRTGSTEVDHLNGEIVLLGRLLGIPTPVNELLQRTVARMAHERAAPGSVSMSDLEAALDHA